MNPVLVTVILLVVSNTFMTFAWYAHLRDLAHKPWVFAALVSWTIALCEYLFQVPANRIGYSALSLPQLKIIQEVITLSVFVPFALLYMRQAWSWNYVWAACCLMGAVFFIFREPGKPKAERPTAACEDPHGTASVERHHRVASLGAGEAGRGGVPTQRSELARKDENRL
jgi:hypothetical protein